MTRTALLRRLPCIQRPAMTTSAIAKNDDMPMYILQASFGGVSGFDGTPRPLCC